MSKKTVLVTGGAGFVGTTLSLTLAAQGHAVTVLDDLSSGAQLCCRRFRPPGRLSNDDVFGSTCFFFSSFLFLRFFCFNHASSNR